MWPWSLTHTEETTDTVIYTQRTGSSATDFLRFVAVTPRPTLEAGEIARWQAACGFAIEGYGSSPVHQKELSLGLWAYSWHCAASCD